MKQNFHLSLGYLGFCVLLTTACLPKTQFAQMVGGATSTSSFQVQTSYPDTGETLSNQPYLSGIAGNNIYSINFFNGTSCSGSSIGSGYRSAFMSGNGIQLTLNPLLSSYDISAKIIYINQTTECLGKVFTYTKRSSNPVRFSTVDYPSPSNTSTPKFTGTIDLDATSIKFVQLYSDAACTHAINPNSASTPWITSATFQSGVTLTLPANATTSIYARAFLEDTSKTEAVPCFSFTSYTVDTNLNDLPIITNKFYYNSYDKSPIISWSVPNDLSGIKDYSYSIGTTAGGTEIATWSAPITVTSFQFTKTGAFTEGTTYYVNIRARDNALNTSNIGTSSWVVKTNPPVLSIKTPDANNVAVANLVTISGTCISPPPTKSNPISFTTSEGVQSIANTDCINNYFSVQTKISAASGVQRSIVAIQSDGEINQSAQRILNYAPLSSFGTTISAGNQHTCGTKDGTLYCWGDPTNDKLGLDDGNSSSEVKTPLRTSRSNLNKNSFLFEQIETGAEHSCALSTDRIAYCWGNNVKWQLGNSLIVKPDDVVDTDKGSDSSPLPVKINMSQVEGGTFKQITVGANHSCGLSDTNKVYCWGQNDNGQTGNKPTKDTNIFTQRATLIPIPAIISQISAGHSHTCALSTSGDIWCWGYNNHYQLGDPSKKPTTVPFSRDPVLVAPGGDMHPGEKFKYVSAGSLHTCAVSTEEDIFCWGARDNGALGISALAGDVTHPAFRIIVNNPNPNSAPIKFKSVSAGGSIYNFDDSTSEGKTDCENGIGAGCTATTGNPIVSPRNQHTCAVTTNNDIYCWGQNNQGQLGNGDTNGVQVSTPTKVVKTGTDIPNIKFTEVKTGFFHTCAKGYDSTEPYNDVIFCWGSYENGKLGLGNNATSLYPAPAKIIEYPN